MANPPTNIMVGSGSGAPGTFNGKNYRPKAGQKPSVTSAEKKQLTTEMAELIAMNHKIMDPGRKVENGVDERKKMNQAAKDQIAENDRKIADLESRGGDRKKSESMSSGVTKISDKDVKKGLTGPQQ